MTKLDVRPTGLVPADDIGIVPVREAAPPRIRAWFRRHRTSLVTLAILLVVVGVVHAWGMDRTPARVDDEGTYVSQAWAAQHWLRLTHYTYWYDHPPLGWLQIAAWTWATRAFERLPNAVAAGREAMLVATLASSTLLYLLGRRLGLRRPAAALAVVLFGLSPLAVQFQRMAFLDNAATPWLIGSFLAAAARRRGIGTAALSAACFAVAVMSKETTLLLLPALVWQLVDRADRRNRRYVVTIFATVLTGLILFYPLYAVLKNELFEGRGHVSLLWAVNWQLFSRPPTGSLLDLSSGSWDVVRTWTDLDPFLLAGAAIAVPIGFAVRRLRPVTLALTILIVATFRNGYLPFPYVIAVIPFAAIVIAGVIDAAWGRRCVPAFVHPDLTTEERQALGRLRGDRASRFPSGIRRGALIVVAVVTLFGVAPAWAEGLHTQVTADRDRPLRLATAWVERNVPHDKRLIVDDSLWTDFTRAGYRHVIWFFKLDLDPAVKLEHGLRDIDYLVLVATPPSGNVKLPKLATAIRHSRVVASYGSGTDQVFIYRLRKSSFPDPHDPATSHRSI